MDGMDESLWAKPGRLALVPLVGNRTDREVAETVGCSEETIRRLRSEGLDRARAELLACAFGKVPDEVWSWEWRRAIDDDPVVATDLESIGGQEVVSRMEDIYLVKRRKSGAVEAAPIRFESGTRLTWRPDGEAMEDLDFRWLLYGTAERRVRRWEIRLGAPGTLVMPDGDELHFVRGAWLVRIFVNGETEEIRLHTEITYLTSDPEGGPEEYHPLWVPEWVRRPDAEP